MTTNLLFDFESLKRPILIEGTNQRLIKLFKMKPLVFLKSRKKL